MKTKPMDRTEEGRLELRRAGTERRLSMRGSIQDRAAEAGDGRRARRESRRMEIIRLARDQHGEEARLEIDDNAGLSGGRDNGCYVAAWVWVDFGGTRFDRERK